MSALTPDQKATLAALLVSQGLQNDDPDSAANKLNTPADIKVSHPKPFSMATLLPLVSPTSRAKVKANMFMDSFIQSVNQNDRQAVMTYATMFKDDSEITNEEYAAIGALMAETVEVDAKGDSPFAAAFPNFSCVVERHAYRYMPDGEYEKDEQGQPKLLTERIPYNRCAPELVIEARA